MLIQGESETEIETANEPETTTAIGSVIGSVNGTAICGSESAGMMPRISLVATTTDGRALGIRVIGILVI